jgi:hypothetical protein
MDEKDMTNQLTDKPNQPESKPNERAGISIQGHLKIYDPKSQEVFVDKRNAIHY